MRLHTTQSAFWKWGLIAWLVLAANFVAIPAHASGANFVLSAQNIELGKVEEAVVNNAAQPPRYATQVELGQPFILVAQGWVYPRGSKGAPATPDKAAWRYDNEDFKPLEYDAKLFDETMSVLRLQPTIIGRTRIRFNGKIFGYKCSFDILLDVVAPKPGP